MRGTEWENDRIRAGSQDYRSTPNRDWRRKWRNQRLNRPTWVPGRFPGKGGAVCCFPCSFRRLEPAKRSQELSIRSQQEWRISRNKQKSHILSNCKFSQRHFSLPCSCDCFLGQCSLGSCLFLSWCISCHIGSKDSSRMRNWPNDSRLFWLEEISGESSLFLLVTIEWAKIGLLHPSDKTIPTIARAEGTTVTKNARKTQSENGRLKHFAIASQQLPKQTSRHSQQPEQAESTPSEPKHHGLNRKRNTYILHRTSSTCRCFYSSNTFFKWIFSVSIRWNTKSENCWIRKWAKVSAVIWDSFVSNEIFHVNESIVELNASHAF